MAAEIIAIANQKGGVAKTTITHNLGVALALKGKKTLMIDLDSQASLTFCAGIKNVMDYEGRNVVELFSIGDEKYYSEVDPPLRSRVYRCIHAVGSTEEIRKNLYIIPSIIDLAQLESVLYGKTFREGILAKKLVPIMDEYDFILLDCPPQLGLMTINALSAADGVLIPVKTDELSYRGLLQLQETIADVKNLINHKLQIYGVIATMYQMRVKQDKEIYEKLCREYRVVATIKQAAVAKKGIYDGISTVEFMPTHEISVNVFKLAEMLIRGMLREDDQ